MRQLNTYSLNCLYAACTGFMHAFSCINPVQAAITKAKGNKTGNTAIAYACVAYRIMEYEKWELSEEYLDTLMGILMDFYTVDEIQKIYKKNIVLDSYGSIMNEEIINRKINE